MDDKQLLPSSDKQNTNEGQGVSPVHDALYWERRLDNGTTEFASIVAWQIDANGLYRAWVWHPRFGCEEMRPTEGKLAGFTPKRVVMADDLPAIIAEMQKPLVAQIEALRMDLVKLQACMEDALVLPVEEEPFVAPTKRRPRG